MIEIIIIKTNDYITNEKIYPNPASATLDDITIEDCP